MSTSLPIVHWADVLIEATTPIAVGTGAHAAYTDAPLARDCNNLPYLPGTSLAGILRHAWEDLHGQESPKDLFGFQERDEGKGSRVIISDGLCVGPDGAVLEGLLDPKLFDKENAVLTALRSPRIRQHVRIGHQGVADNGGKFDREVGLCGTRFCFRLALLSAEVNDPQWTSLLDLLGSGTLRVGGKTRAGSGRFEVRSCKVRTFDLRVADDRQAYLDSPNSLKQPPKGAQARPLVTSKLSTMHTFELKLEPESTFYFGSRSGVDSDAVPVTESTLSWQGDKATLSNKDHYLIPASSVKGALAHRVAYHYNLAQQVFADDPKTEIAKHVGAENAAVLELFGNVAGESGKAGKVFIDDLYLPESEYSDKTFQHVSIDRFTGGALDGHLFDEKVLVANASTAPLLLAVQVQGWASISKASRDALTAALRDLCEGRLPLGGHVLRGHGTFLGTQSETPATNEVQP